MDVTGSSSRSTGFGHGKAVARRYRIVHAAVRRRCKGGRFGVGERRDDLGRGHGRAAAASRGFGHSRYCCFGGAFLLLFAGRGHLFGWFGFGSSRHAHGGAFSSFHGLLQFLEILLRVRAGLYDRPRFNLGGNLFPFLSVHLQSRQEGIVLFLGPASRVFVPWFHEMSRCLRIHFPFVHGWFHFGG